MRRMVLPTSRQLGDSLSAGGHPLPAVEGQPQRPTGASRIGRLSRLAAALAVTLAVATAQTPAPSPQAVLAAARAALGPASPPLAGLELQGAFRLQPPGSGRQQQGQLQIRFVPPANYQRRLALRLGVGDFVTTETLAAGQASVRRQVPSRMASRFSAYRRRGGQFSAAQRAAFAARRQARLQRRLTAQWARDQLSFLLQPPPGASLRYAGLAQAPDGQQADMIQVTASALTAPVTLFLDRHSHRLLMLSYSGFAPGRRGGYGGGGRDARTESPGTTSAPHGPRPAPQTILVHFTHWRRVQGHWFPFEITQSAAGATFSEWDLKRVRRNPPGLDATSLGKP